ncbi:Mur ligase family protein [Candidatus Beckwithbacteria bacterium]|nr:Mur ligase family protein [Candidatus Beckwithbacteria bacterium]
MNLQTLLAWQAGMLTKKLIVTRGKSRGETAPGLVALKFDPQFVANHQGQFDTRIIISGTNGKTTTTSMVLGILQKSKIKAVSNPSGSNLLRGIASALIDVSPKIKTAVWEIDEAALIPVTTQVKPTHILLTNLFRDQLDRYGEIDTIAKKWLKLLQALPKTILLLNRDDPSLVYIGSQLPQHKIVYFGLEPSNNKQIPTHGADAIFCPNCHKPLQYQSITYSHLGNYTCNCGFKQPKAQFVAKHLELKTSQLLFDIEDQKYLAPLSGMYNIYNSLAAIALAKNLAIQDKIIKNSLKAFTPAFGRQEIFKIGDKALQLLLVKNPTGFNEVISMLKNLGKKITIAIAINDKIADGTDVSWLWDVDFESLQPYINKVIVTGDRALDMAVRLKYAGFNPKQYLIHKDKSKALATLINQTDKNLYLLPTYTAMWEMREIIKKYKNL